MRWEHVGEYEGKLSSEGWGDSYGKQGEGDTRDLSCRALRSL